MTQARTRIIKRPRTEKQRPEMLTKPLRFYPYLRPMVWGGRRLAEMLGKPLTGSEPFGESWDVTDHASHRGVVATGPHAGRTLRELMESHRASLLGPAAAHYETFPWLVKFLDAADWLSVQVHPDEEKVKRHWPGEGPKTEAWFVIDAAPGSRIYAGLLPGVDEKHLRRALAAGTVAECLHQFEPRPGDCLFLPAGTVHAVGGGVLMAEVQQTSDATFRLFDWNRKDAQGNSRKLHIEEAIACIDWSRGPVHPRRTADSEVLVSCPYFTLEHRRAREPFTCGGSGRLELLVILWGRGHLGDEPVERGQAWVLPASMSRTTCTPDAPIEALICTLP
jgi:mannose-6-phosphate isomerase